MLCKEFYKVKMTAQEFEEEKIWEEHKIMIRNTKPPISEWEQKENEDLWG